MVLTLLNIAIPGAVADAVGGVLGGLTGENRPRAGLTLQANFTYGSGGTSVDAWVQTSLDGGETWIDITNFHFTTASARKLANVNAETSVTSEYTPTDGSLSPAGAVVDGILCDALRVKYTVVGTYVASSLVITAVPS
jgi:hypothetical protein